jgi:hypothetical protein
MMRKEKKMMNEFSNQWFMQVDAGRELRNALEMLTCPGEYDGSRQIACDMETIRPLLIRVEDNLLDLIFSGADEVTIKRCFSYVIAELSEWEHRLALVKDQRQKVFWLTGRCRHACKNFMVHLKDRWPNYFDRDQAVTQAIYKPWVKKINVMASQVNSRLLEGKADAALKVLIADYLGEVSTAFSFRPTYYALDYAMGIVNRLEEETRVLADTTSIDERISYILSELNFNHLAFFTWRINRLTLEKHSISNNANTYYSNQLNHLYPLTLSEHPPYDKSLPGLPSLLYHWIKEQKDALQMIQVVAPPTKLFLDLSVPQLACLLHCLYDAGIFGNIKLTALFQFASSHFRTRRQDNVSAGSLGKEYYIIGQQTAARLMGLLEQLTTNLRKVYFPVWAAIGISVFCG